MEKQRHTVTPRVMCLIFNKNKVLFLKASTQKDWNGYFDPPGGPIEKGEDPLMTAKREIFEETGLKVAKIKLLGVIHVSGFFGKDVMMFVVKAMSDKTKVKKSSEGIPIWLDIDKIDNYKFIEDMKPILKKVLSIKKGDFFVGVSQFDGKDKLLSFDIKLN
jgi:8-oxo-dGTP pyrophosphatase MutT (NUDIX family)